MTNEDHSILKDSGGMLIGEMLFAPRNNCEFQGMIELVSIGFDQSTPEGYAAVVRCLQRHFLKKKPRCKSAQQQ